jgi:hypothetical protein
MKSKDKSLVTHGADADVTAFLETLERTPAGGAGRGRLLFALDATASRQPTWDRAAHLQSDMFVAAAGLGGLSIQLCFYRGYGEFRASPWVTDASDLVRMMGSVRCRAGETQICKVLQHAINEASRERMGALVFVGDCVEENIDELAGRAGELGTLGVPAFMFHEGLDLRAQLAFKEIARLTSGAYCRFDAGSADTLRALLCAVAVYAAGGRRALTHLADHGSGAAKQIALQLPGR